MSYITKLTPVRKENKLIGIKIHVAITTKAIIKIKNHRIIKLIKYI
jgi:hypothetical protein